MIVIGLTGSIGMGKSTAADMLRTMGLPVHDADAEVHRLLGPRGEAVARIAQMFPESRARRIGPIDRGRLGRIVFADPAALAALEGILHPLVRAAQARFLRAAQRSGARAAVLDIPLLFETGADRLCDATICVSAPFFLQKRRVLARGLPEAEFYRRLNNQMSDAEKRRLADFVVPTGAGRALAFSRLKKIIGELTS